MSTLKINRGTTYTLGVNYQRNGVPTTLVGATVRFTIKDVEYDASTDDSTADLKKDVTNGTSSGTAEIIINPADTATLIPNSYYYDIKVQDASGAIYKIDEGKVKLDGSPTNRTT